MRIKLAVAALTLAAALAAPIAAQAVTLVGPTTFPTGLNGLIVDGSTYNVTFLDDVDYDQAYPNGSPPTFLGNIPGASDAATAITLALNSLATFSPTIIIPYVNLSSPNGGLANGDFLVDIQTAVTTNEIFDDFASPGFAYTSFVAVTDVPTPTPLPAALPLFVSGLGALGLLARRRKRKAALAA